jgi:hypothetical protein
MNNTKKNHRSLDYLDWVVVLQELVVVLIQYLHLEAQKPPLAITLFIRSLLTTTWLLQVDLELLMFSSSVAVVVVVKTTTQVDLVVIMVEPLAAVVLEHLNILQDYH